MPISACSIAGIIGCRNSWTSDSVYFTVYDEAGNYVESPDGGAVFDFYDSTGTYKPATLTQSIDISDTASTVATGGVGFNLSGYLLKFLSASKAIIRVEMFDASGVQIAGGTHELVAYKSGNTYYLIVNGVTFEDNTALNAEKCIKFTVK